MRVHRATRFEWMLIGAALALAPAQAAAQTLARPLPGLPSTLARPIPARSGASTRDATQAAAPGGVRHRRGWGRVAVHTNAWRFDAEGRDTSTLNEVITSASYRVVDREDDGVEFGVDVRHSGFTAGERPSRVSIYEGFVGARLRDGALNVRAGHLWLNDLGSLGAVAGAQIEVGQRATGTTRWGRLRAGLFGGGEPRLYRAGYESNIRKLGGYALLHDGGSRRHVVGLVQVRNGSLTERSVLVTTNAFPIGSKAFVYQAAEYDLERPAGEADPGLTYAFGTLRVSPSRRLDLQATVSRGRSVDVRGLGQDVLAGRPVAQRNVEGLRYQSVGGRATVEVLTGIRAYAGYTRDTDNRGEPATHRWLFGGYAADVLRTGLDLTASDSMNRRPSGTSHARYLSVGRSFGRRAYVTMDYSTSLVVLSFTRNDGLLIESRPRTRRIGASTVVTLTRAVSLLATVDRTTDGSVRDLRLTTGLTYRLR